MLAYLKRLSENNNKEWFDANKKEYDAMRKEWIVGVAKLIENIALFDTDIAGLDAKNCIFRINRDVRFSNNKLPYKSNFGASINKGGKKVETAGYYFQIQPNDVFIAGGCYTPMPDKLAAIRQEIDYNFDAFKKIITSKDYTTQFGQMSGDKLVRPPKGYDADNAAIEYLKHKSFLSYKKINDEALFEPNFEKELLKTFKAMKPLNDFINSAIQ